MSIYTPAHDTHAPSSHFCTFLGAPPMASKALSSSFLPGPLHPANSGSSSQVPSVCYVPWLHRSQLRRLFSVPAWGLCWLLLSNVLVSHKCRVPYSPLL